MKYTPRTEKEFFRKNILENSYIKENIQLLEKWYNTDEDRENIAQQLGIPLGKLLKIFNHTAPISRKHFFQWRNYKFSYTEMWGLVDDYWGDRFGKFGTPVTLRTPHLFPWKCFTWPIGIL